jgi:hypothetical protein
VHIRNISYIKTFITHQDVQAKRILNLTVGYVCSQCSGNVRGTGGNSISIDSSWASRLTARAATSLQRTAELQTHVASITATFTSCIGLHSQLNTVKQREVMHESFTGVSRVKFRAPTTRDRVNITIREDSIMDVCLIS